MAELRSKPYIYVTWMARLLAGTRSCEWASWFKTQHEGWSWKKVPSDFDLAAWTMRHAALVKVERDRLEAEGAEVFAEQQNHFKVRGRAATLSGQPDLVSVSAEGVVVHDIKTGEPNAADAAQVVLYMWALPLAKPRYRNVALEGRVVYAGHAVDIPASAVDDAFKANTVALIERLATESPTRKTPSHWECGFCEITAEDCPDRIEEKPPTEETEVF